MKEEMLLGKRNEILHYVHYNLPKEHSYIQIIGNFFFLSEFWRKDSV